MAQTIEHFDIAIIGGGPAGYVGAIHAAHLGKKVCLIEKDRPGGTCLWKGCIPSKAILASAETCQKIKTAAAFGIKVEGTVTPDFSAIIKRKENILNILGTGILSLLKGNKIPLIQGTAQFKNSRTLEIHPQEGEFTLITADNILIATGSKPAHIPGLSFDGEKILSTEHIFAITELPQSMIILGAGYSGCEMAFAFSELGTEVTVVEMMPGILPNADREIADLLGRQFRKHNIKVLTDTKILAVDLMDDPPVTAHLSKGEPRRAEKLLVTVGRTVNSRNLNLEQAGVVTGAQGEILVNEKMETNIPGIYAAGDVTGKLMLAHVASKQAITAINNIAGKATLMDYSCVPSCTFTHPPVASVGITEEQCQAQGIEYEAGKYFFRSLGAAQVKGELDGMVKIIAEKDSGKMLGIHILGPGAPEMLSEGTLALANKLTAKEFASHIRAHPSLPEGIMEAAENIFGISFHSLPQ
jgi:dihydrolipoamide dehydrogenase